MCNNLPAMPAEVERLFSSNKLSLTPQRRRMTDKMLEILELVRHWYHNEITIFEIDSEASENESDSDSEVDKEI